MSELLREIEEDIRRERLQKLWQSFGKTMVRISIAVVIGTIVAVAWQHHKQGVATEKTATLLKSVNQQRVGDIKGALATLDEVIAAGASPYAGLALLQKARLEAQEKNPQGEADAYKKLAAAGPEYGEAFVSLARLASPEASTETVKSDPFYFSQSELEAWERMKSGKTQETADSWMNVRDDAEAPRSLRARAGALAEYLKSSVKE